MVNRILILCAILGAVSAIQLLGAEKCTWGPAHWCASLENAKNCGPNSEQYCRRKVWVGDHPLAPRAQPIPDAKPAVHKKSSMALQKILSPFVAPLISPKTGGNCALCELIGHEIFSKLKNNATEEEVVEEMEALCQLLPASYADSCTEFVEEYGKEFFEEFLNNVSVHDLCAYLGLCSEEFLSIVKESNMMAMIISKNFKGVECDTCQEIMALLQKEILANEKALEGMLDAICAKLPVDPSECDQFVNGMFEALVSLLESYNPEELCQMVDLCSSLLDTLSGVGPVSFGQVGQTGPASPENVFGTDDSCQNGPAFWCASEKNAKLCEMEEFCKKQAAPLVF